VSRLVDLQEWRTKQYTLTRGQQIMAIGSIGIIVLLVSLYIMNPSEVTPNDPNSNANVHKAGQVVPNKTDNQVTEPSESIRNPFAATPESGAENHEFSPLLPGPSPTIPNAPANTYGSVPNSNFNMSTSNLQLAGVMGNGYRRLAVIKSGDKSRSYGLNEFVGTDKIVAITDNYVVLTNGDRKIVLRLESAGQKEGNNIEK